MALLVSAQVIRELIVDGDYMVESIEQREHGRIDVTLALRSRAQPYAIQIETADSRLEGLFRALLNGKGADDDKHPAVRLGSQPVPVIEVDALPADQPKRRRQRAGRAASAEAGEAEQPATPAKRRRAAMRQMIKLEEQVPESSTGTAPSQRSRRTSRLRALRDL